MIHPLLPKLKNSKVGNFDKAGVWFDRPREELKNLSESLDVTPIQMEINSIPDMWARPLLFEMALFDDKHVLHRRVLGEWRGLLALLALKEVEELQQFEAHKVEVLTAAPQAEANARKPETNFLVTLAKLRPEASVCSNTNWNTLFLFLFNKRPIGMTSPTTLVVTATDSLNRIYGISWFDGKRLGDPTNSLPRTQRNALAGWLDNLILNLGRHPTLDVANRGNLLLGLLRSFLNDLGVTTPVFKAGESSLGIKGMEAGIFIHLDKPAARPTNGIEASHVSLKAAPDRKPETVILVVERDIATEWRMQPQDVVVYGALTLEHVPYGGLGQNRQQIANTQLHGAEWRLASDFFTTKLAVIAQEKALPGTLLANSGPKSLTYAHAEVTPLLPLKRELLTYLSPEELNQRLTLELTSNGIRARLALPLSGPDQNGADYVIEKIFADTDIVTFDANPIVEVWPNINKYRMGSKGERIPWSAFYTCYSADNVETTFQIEPFIKGEKVPCTEIWPTSRALRQFWQSESYPEAMLCQARVPNADGTAMVSQDVGLLPLTRPNSEALQNQSYRVGIDFGASSTSVYTKIGNNKNAVVFQDRRSSITNPGALEDLYDFFVPVGNIEMPFLSLYQDFLADPTAQKLKPFLDGHIYFFQDYSNLNAAASGMATDLKWSEDPQDRIRVKAFLTQLCLQIAAEAVARGANSIDWSFSYPTAFTEGMLGDFPAIWDAVTQECCTLAGLVRPNAPQQQTESIAAAMFFREIHNASTQSGAICIDIGGSTSDISIWMDNRLIWQASLRYAGRDIFLNRLWFDPSFLEPLGIDVTPLRERKRENNRTAFYSQADALLRQHSKPIFETLPIHGGTPSIKKLKQHVALGLSGVFYYIGSILRYLIEDGKYTNEQPNVYVGGNGSQMFRWLGPNDRSNKLFKTAFNRGVGWGADKPFCLTQSAQPKAETAYGLVCDWDLELGNSGRDEVVAGEDFQQDGSKHGWQETLKADAFTKKLGCTADLPRLRDFLSAFNDFANSEGTFDALPATDQLMSEIRARVEQSLSRYRGRSSTADVMIEPVFILALKHLLDIHNERVAEQ